MNEAVDLLLNAQNPLIYAGEGVIYAGASEELKSFAESLNAPVITTLKAKGAFPGKPPAVRGGSGRQSGGVPAQERRDTGGGV